MNFEGRGVSAMVNSQLGVAIGTTGKREKIEKKEELERKGQDGLVGPKLAWAGVNSKTLVVGPI